MKHRDFECWIECDEKRLAEYDITVDDEKTVSSYVVSEEGKRFQICCNGLSGNDSSLIILLDGRTVGKKIVRMNRRDLTFKGLYISPNTRLPFIFSRIIVTDDDTALCDIPNSDELGTIELRVYRAKFGPQAPPKFLTDSVQVLGPIHEKTKKAGAHCATFGDPEKSATHKQFRSTFLDSRDNPYMVFRFKYRPLEFLQAQGIVPLPEASAIPDEATRAKGGRKKRLPQGADNKSNNGHHKRPRHDHTNESDPGPSRHAAPHSLEDDTLGVDIKSMKPCKDEGDEADEDDVDMLKAQLKTVHDAMQMSTKNMQDLQGRLDRMEAKRRSRQSKVAKKEVSPIRLASSSGDVIDLTDD